MHRKISPSLRYAVLHRCGFRCYYCGIPGNETRLHVDHVMPWSHGGTNTAWNLVAACPTCNRGKSNTLPGRDLLDKIYAEYQQYVTLRGNTSSRCSICGHILEQPPLEADEDPLSECLPCNAAIADAYEAGWRAGGGEL